MNTEQTLALFRRGKSAWSDWAANKLNEKRLLEESSLWQLSEEGRPANDETRSWLDAATADFARHHFDEDVDCSAWSFPGPVTFEQAQFKQATFRRTTFMQLANFGRANFKRPAHFDEASFDGRAVFSRARLERTVSFSHASFRGIASFQHISVVGAASFGRASFARGVSFDRAELAGANFDNATFALEARFDHAHIAHGASFEEAIFNGPALFHGTKFDELASFNSVKFAGPALFSRAKFALTAQFTDAEFSGWVDYQGAEFAEHARFQGVGFLASASFAEATFRDFCSFRATKFLDRADFSAVHAERTFDLAEAKFFGAPNFIQARFSEAPRLDGATFLPYGASSGSLRLKATRRMRAIFRPEENAAARWRALRRLAVQGHDHDRELDFFAREIRSRRFGRDHPFTWRIWSKSAWAGMGRWWLGWGYQLTSDFGRSVARPLFLWVGSVLVAAGLYLNEAPSSSVRGEPAYLISILDALWRDPRPCYSPESPGALSSEARFGLGEGARMGTNASIEAWILALRSGSIFLDGGAEAAHRTYGCLYGVERFGERLVPIVPSRVSLVASLHKLISAVLIFLIALAIRNKLRMK